MMLRRLVNTARTLICAAGLFACASSNVPTSDAPVAPPLEIVPYRIDYQGWITIDAYVNGAGPHDFIVDSGATTTSIFANLTARQDFSEAAREPIRILGLAGSRSLPAHTIGNVGIAGLALENHVGVILPDWAPPNTPPQGVLGLDFLARYGVFFDARRREMRLYEHNTYPEQLLRDWSSAAFEPVFFDDGSRPLYKTTVVVRGARIPCILDLGASGTIFNTPAFRRMMSGIHVNRAGQPGFSTGSRIRDVFDNRDQAQAVQLSRMRIGGATWTNQVAIVYDAQIFRELGVSGVPFCLAGADLFADRSFMFDFAGEALYIGPRRRL